MEADNSEQSKKGASLVENPCGEPRMEPEFLTRAVVAPRGLFQASLSQPHFTVSKPG